MKKLILVIGTALCLNTQAQICFGPINIFKTNGPQQKVTAYSIVSADFNGDGKTDIATTNGFTDINGNHVSNVSILLGTGAGTFIPTDTFVVDFGAAQIISSDFNNDGHADLATVNYYSPTNVSSVSVLLGTGTGSFLPATNFWSGFAPASITGADFNGDGFIDYATANPSLQSVCISLGTGTGSFSAPTSFTAGGYACSVIHADFNGDGKVDLATANGDSNNVSILLGAGNGSFGAASSYTAGVWSWDYPAANHNGGVAHALISADFNGDGKLDLAVSHSDTTIISILLGSGTGSFGATTDFSVDAAGSPNQLMSADINGDGKTDIVTANTLVSIFPTLVMVNNTISVLTGNGTGGFGTATSFTVGDRPQWAVSSDFNGDGRADLAVADTAVSVLLNCALLGIEQVANDNKFNVYPNPARDMLIIECLTENEKNTLVISNMLGDVVKRVAFNTPQLNLNIGNLSEGIYTVSLQSNGRIISKKLVVVH